MLNVQDIPDELWLDGMLGMPMCLRMSYWNQLESYGLTEEALAPDTTGPQIVGGRSEEATRQHFARRYGVSASRIESLAIDPHRAFGVIPDDLLVSLSEGHISVLDVACGAGAVGASLLSTVSVLRATGRLPKMPLDVSIVGGDCSDSALVMYRQMIEELRPTLCAVGIEVDLVATRWEAEESYSTSEMFDLLFERNPDSDEYLVIIANFAGVLESHFSKFEDSIVHIFDRTGNKKCTIMWVEPGQPSAKTLLRRLERIVEKCTPWRSADKRESVFHEYEWYHPFRQCPMPCRVLVKEYRRS